jgi:hypothetical protein
MHYERRTRDNNILPKQRVNDALKLCRLHLLLKKWLNI